MSGADKYDTVMMIIGGRTTCSRQRAIEAAHEVKTIGEQYPDATLSLHLEGWDDDPRELWEIPEARKFMRQFALTLYVLGLPPRFIERQEQGSLPIDWRMLP